MKSRSGKAVDTNGLRRWGIALLLAWGGCLCLPKLMPWGGRELIFTNSFAAAAVWGGLAAVLQKALSFGARGGKRRWVMAGGLSFLFSAGMAFGAGLEEAEYVAFTDGKMWAAIGVWGIIVTLLVCMAWSVLAEVLSKPGSGEERSGEERAGERKAEQGSGGQVLSESASAGQAGKRILLTAGLIMICWLPVFLAVYPGFFVYDAQDEYMQVVTREFSSHHPLVHVLLLGGTVHGIYKLSGSYNLGIAAYTLLQMAILGLIFAYGIHFLRQRKVTFRCCAFTLLYLGFFPVVVMFSLCSAKDGLFTGMLLLLFLMIRELCEQPAAFLASWGKQMLFVIGAAGVMLLRHNGRYAFWLFAVVLWCYCRRRAREREGKPGVLARAGTGADYRRLQYRLLWLTGAGLAIYFIGSSGLSMILKAEPGGRQEMLTVPIQQMARLYNDEGDTLSPEDKAALYEYLPREALSRYVPKVSDGVKVDFNNAAFAADPQRLLKLWAGWGVRHPFTYLNAWLMTSYGFWYPDAVIDVYRGNTVFTYTYEDSSYFGYEVENPGIRDSKLPWLAEWYRRLSLEITQQKIPVVAMLFSPGFVFWCLLFGCGFVWEQKKYRRLLPCLLPLLVWLTVILGPTYLVRYVVFLWVLAPWLIQGCYGRFEKEV